MPPFTRRRTAAKSENRHSNRGPAAGLLPFHPAPFFKDKNQAFWRLQIMGWGGAMLLRVITNVANDKPLDFVITTLIAAITGFSISLILSVIYGRLIHMRPLVTWVVTALVLMVAVAISAVINGWTLSLYHGTASDVVTLALGVYFIDMMLLGAWSALYYAINYYLQVEEQADRLERLEAQATSAQLAMLRYQLNPHFLFNTLNSISTLVLLRQTEPANAMLTRLSSFLRHTLVSEAGGKVSVEQEVETLKLYLDIERMRFEDRLRTDFKIDPAAAHAVVPSLLLQPLVENAIKYAVSPQEEGACISINAHVIADRLRITVADTGPGVHARARHDATTAGRLSSTSTGVGLVNIRDRLTQAYGDNHLYDIQSPPEGGFTVVIEIPFEAAEAASPGHSSSRQSAPASTSPYA